jgi:hypothetical protein
LTVASGAGVGVAAAGAQAARTRLSPARRTNAENVLFFMMQFSSECFAVRFVRYL